MTVSRSITSFWLTIFDFWFELVFGNDVIWILNLIILSTTVVYILRPWYSQTPMSILSIEHGPWSLCDYNNFRQLAIKFSLFRRSCEWAMFFYSMITASATFRPHHHSLSVNVSVCPHMKTCFKTHFLVTGKWNSYIFSRP